MKELAECDQVVFKTAKRLDAEAVSRFFKRVELNDWFTRRDVTWYLGHALRVFSAWSGKECVGLAVLTGDGRIDMSVDLLAVDAPMQGRGIGTRLMKRIVGWIERAKPYHVRIEVFERRTEKYYARFGFGRNKGTWLLEHIPTADRLRSLARAARSAREID